MNQKYVVRWREPHNPMTPDPMAQLKELVPEAKVMEKRGDLYLIECPVSCEADLFAYFEGDDCVISRNQTYRLAAVESQSGKGESS